MKTMRLVFAAIVFACAVNASAQTTNLAETNLGRLLFKGNELLVQSFVDDPPAIRLGAPDTQRSLGKISFDIRLGGESLNEVVLIQGKQTENANNELEGRGGEFYLGLARRNGGTTDDAMVDALTATVDGGFQFRLPIYAPNLSGGSLQPWVLISPNSAPTCRMTATS